MFIWWNPNQKKKKYELLTHDTMCLNFKSNMLSKISQDCYHGKFSLHKFVEVNTLIYGRNEISGIWDMDWELVITMRAQGTLWNDRNILNSTVVLVYKFFQTYWTVHIQCVNFTLAKLCLNKVNKNELQ